MKRTLIVVLVGALLITAALAAAQQGRAPAVAESPGSAAGVPVQTVLVTAITAGTGGPIRTMGTLRAQKEVNLAFPVSGVVEAVIADEGDAVAAGDVLARLDPVPYRSAVIEAEARITYLQSRLSRAERLFNENLVSEEHLEQVTSELRVTEARLELARWNLDRTELRAPFDGRVLRRTVERGQVVSGEVAVYELLAVDELEVTVGVAAKDLPRVLAASEIRVRLTDRPEVEVMGWIDHIPVSSDPASGTVPVVVRVSNPDGALLPGLLVECEFAALIGAGTELALARPGIPVSTLRMTSFGPGVFLVEGDIVRSVPVTVEQIRGETVIVRDGVSPGDLLVDEPPDRLRDGDRVLTASAG